MNQAMSSTERRYLDQFPDVDQDLVGPKLGLGAQHVVRSFDYDRVIKYPRMNVRSDVMSLIISRILTPSADKLKNDLDTSREYFGDEAVLPTDILTDIKGRVYCMLQPKMTEFESLTPDIIDADADVAEELAVLVEAGNKLFSDKGKFLDMMGWNLPKIMRGDAYLDNVVKVPAGKKKLRLPDITLFPKPDYSILGAYFQRVLEFQRSNMRKFKMKFAE